MWGVFRISSWAPGGIGWRERKWSLQDQEYLLRTSGEKHTTLKHISGITVDRSYSLGASGMVVRFKFCYSEGWGLSRGSNTEYV